MYSTHHVEENVEPCLFFDRREKRMYSRRGFLFVCVELSSLMLWLDSLCRRSENGCIVGFSTGTPWRTIARQRTGSGEAIGVDLNLPWPTLPSGIRPDYKR